MDTYELTELIYENTPDYVYEYPDSFSIKDVIFQHIGYGLYMVKAEKDKHLYKSDIRAYENMSFVFVRDSEEVLFAYSNRYSTWNYSVLCVYLKEHLEELTLDTEMLQRISAIRRDEWGLALEERCTRYYEYRDEKEQNELDTPYACI